MYSQQSYLPKIRRRKIGIDRYLYITVITQVARRGQTWPEYLLLLYIIDYLFYEKKKMFCLKQT